MLTARIKSETKFIEDNTEKIKSLQKNPAWKYYREERLTDMWKSIDNLKEMRDNVEKDDAKLGLPNIPIDKNTHTKTTDGYVYDKTKIIIQGAVKDDLAVNLLQERVKSMWNALPDDIRDSVGRLMIKKSRATDKTRKWQGGRWDDDTRTIYLNINAKTTDVEHNFYHEVGHGRWHRLVETNPEKVQKFMETVKEIGSAPTPYAQSFSMIKEKNMDSEKRYRAKMARGNFVIPERAEKILEKNRRSADDLYQNEIHSELNAYAMGSLPVGSPRAKKEIMDKLLDAYKELWDLK